MCPKKKKTEQIINIKSPLPLQSDSGMIHFSGFGI